MAVWLEDNVEAVCDRLMDRLRDEVPEYFEGVDPVMVDAGRDGAVANLLAIAHGLGRGRSLPDQLPTGVVEEALAVAQEGLPWISLLRTYTIGHASVWEQLTAEVESWGLEDRRRVELLRVVSRYLFGYIDRVTGELAEVYQQERDRILRSQERRRTALIRELLAGMPVSEDQLGYRLRVDHLGVVAWGREPEAVATELAQQLGCALLIAPGAGRSIWAWLGGRSTIDTSAQRKLGRFAPADGTFVACGEVASGPEGFARTHRQALLAYRVAVVGGRRLTRYAEVALEALVIQDERLAREFMEGELGPLVAADARVAELRRTLRAYFGAGGNASAAGALLGVHDRTVAYRLSTVEERIGHPLTKRRDELAVALRIYDLLVSEPSDDDDAAEGDSTFEPGATGSQHLS
jgi:DNA-binding PucR family transcriptional regulator